MNKDEDIYSLRRSANPEEFLDWKINNLLVGMVYTSLFSRFINKYGSEKTKVLLRNIGTRTAQLVVDKYKYKGKNFFHIIKYCLGKFWSSKAKVEQIEKNSEYLIIIKDCVFCSSLGGKLENLENIHYCEPTGSFIEEFYNIIANKRQLKYSKIKVETIASKVTGSENCQYKIRIID